MPVLKVWISVAAMLLLGVAAGVAWQWQAEPAQWLVRPDGSIVMTEAAARDQFGVILVFAVVGAIVSLVWGFASPFALRELGWRLTPLIVVVTLVAALIAWQVGIELGPVGPRDAVNPAVGELLPSKLEVDSLSAFVVWPMAGLAGLVLSTLFSNDADEQVDVYAS